MSELSTVRTILAIAAKKNLKVYHSDVPNAFIQAYIDSDVYVRLPDGISFVDPKLKAGSKGRIPKLLRALYGLRQSPSLWNKELNCFFVETLGYTRCKSDSCLYYKVNIDSSEFILASVNVDDIVIAANEAQFLKELRESLQTQYRVDQFEPVHTLLGVHVEQHSDGSITLDVTAKIEALFAQHPILKNLHTAHVPMPRALSLDERPLTATEEYVKQHFSSLVGSLLFLCMACRPDIAQALGRCSRGMHAPEFKHVVTLCSLLKYLQKPENQQLVLKYDPHNAPILEVFAELARDQVDLATIQNVSPEAVAKGQSDPAITFTDADYATSLEDGRKSTTGYAVYIFGCLVSWKSRLQPIIATSTHQAELIALCTGADETLWIRKLLRDLGFAINSHFWKREHQKRLSPSAPSNAKSDLQTLDELEMLSKHVAEFSGEDKLDDEDPTDFIRPTPMMCDNMGTTLTANNPISGNRSKAISVRWFKIREYISQGKLRVHHIGTKLNVSDGFTKPLDRTQFQQFRHWLGMMPPDSQ